MGLLDWMQQRGRYRLDYKQLEAVSGQAEALLKKRDFKGLRGLVEKYRDSYEAVDRISMKMAVEKPVRTPEDAADKEMVGLMQTLRQTGFMQQEGSRLADISPENAGGIHAMLAMHTFMLDRYLDKHPESGIQRPEKTEVDAAGRILDKRYEGTDAWQLSQFILCRTIPSEYVIQRYGLAEDRERYYQLNDRCLEACETGDRRLERELSEQLYEVELRFERNSERALESIDNVRAPDAYLMYLSEELEKLAVCVWNPSRIEDVGNDFLRRHGIRADSPPVELEKQVENAYKSLDERIVKLCGRPPYADNLLAEKRKQTEPRHEKQQHVQRQPPQLPKQKSRGMKPSF